ncbi:hypothetical protein ACIP4Y_38025 [Streptomyces sp. NPDC088810]|uniref:hypothetical protein n=1 Tax=Streptomyces sp. NPDC088810 TaxID=3365904 RepID=UPI003802236B
MEEAAPPAVAPGNGLPRAPEALLAEALTCLSRCCGRPPASRPHSAPPPEAYRRLLSLDLTRYRLAPLDYDTVHSRRRSELDEVEPR